MTKNKVLLWIFASLASIAIIMSVCFLFLGSKSIDIVPTSVKVELIDGKHCLSTDYNNEFCYQFKLEQKLDNDFVLISTVTSKNNIVALEDCGIEIVAGEIYRFSARYTGENGAGKGKFCNPEQWQASLELGKVENIVYNKDQQSLSWDRVNMAETYAIKLVDAQGDVIERTTSTNSILLSDVEVGSYRVFIYAKTSNDFIAGSDAGQGFEIVIERTNIIYSATFDGELTVVTSQLVNKFEVYSGETLKAIIDVVDVEKDGDSYVYHFVNANAYLAGLEDIKIKSVETNVVFESELFDVA